MEVLAFGVHIDKCNGTEHTLKIRREVPCSFYSKLARKVNTSFFSVASDASEIMPSVLRR